MDTGAMVACLDFGTCVGMVSVVERTRRPRSKIVTMIVNLIQLDST